MSAYHKSVFAALINHQALPSVGASVGKSYADTANRILQTLAEENVTCSDDKIDDTNVDTSGRLMGTKGKVALPYPTSNIMPDSI